MGYLSYDGEREKRRAKIVNGMEKNGEKVWWNTHISTLLPLGAVLVQTIPIYRQSPLPVVWTIAINGQSPKRIIRTTPINDRLLNKLSWQFQLVDRLLNQLGGQFQLTDYPNSILWTIPINRPPSKSIVPWEFQLIDNIPNQLSGQFQLIDRLLNQLCGQFQIIDDPKSIFWTIPVNIKSPNLICPDNANC